MVDYGHRIESGVSGLMGWLGSFWEMEFWEETGFAVEPVEGALEPEKIDITGVFLIAFLGVFRWFRVESANPDQILKTLVT